MRRWLKRFWAAAMVIMMSAINALPAAAETSAKTGDSGIQWTYILIAVAAVLVIIVFLFLGRKRK